jgi:hypothetical protein
MMFFNFVAAVFLVIATLFGVSGTLYFSLEWYAKRERDFNKS